MKILAIETSCDETAAAITEGLSILSSVKYTQEIHAHWGGVVPNLAKRAHQERIDQIIDLAMSNAQVTSDNIDALAVTVGPGLAVALEVGVRKAKQLASEWHKPLIAVNHIEGHVLSQLVTEGAETIKYPALALVISGGHTQLIRVETIGQYSILAKSLDDDIGEALDKAARMLGLGYPGGPILEKMAAQGDPTKYPMPLPMAGQEGTAFSYSGLKSAMWRLVQQEQPLTEEKINDLAASFQAMVFKHLIRTLKKLIPQYPAKDLLVGGGVAANQTLRQLLNVMGEELGLKIWYPPNLTMCTDNAAMIGIAAGFKAERGEFSDPNSTDRLPRWRIDQNTI